MRLAATVLYSALNSIFDDGIYSNCFSIVCTKSGLFVLDMEKLLRASRNRQEPAL